MNPERQRDLYGVLAEFANGDALLEALRKARSAGHTACEAFTPFPMAEVADLLPPVPNRVPLITLLGGLLGGFGGYFLQWYTAVIDYPINVGGRPLHSWPSFIPPTFEMTVLGAALACFFGVLLLNGLPSSYHPLFNVDDFGLASRNRFFLCLRLGDEGLDAAAARNVLQGLEPLGVWEVPR